MSDVKDVLHVKELLANGLFTPLNNAKLLDLTSGTLYIQDGKDIRIANTTGTKIGITDNNKIGFWGVTPVVQQVLATGGGATVDNVITMLQTIGLCKQS